MSNKAPNYIYQIHIPGDDDDYLCWFYVFGSRTVANAEGRRIAADKGWKFAYISATSDKRVSDYWGKKTIVCEQTETVYHGA